MQGIDVIVVNYRTPGDLERFLRSYEAYGKTTDTHLWIVNVDPLPDDTSVAMAALRRNARANVLEHQTNVGYARAVNDAAARGRKETIAIFNADTELTPDALASCHAALHANDWAILGPRQVDDAGRITHAGIFGTLDHPQHRGWREHGSGYTDVLPAVTVSGAAYFIKRSVWDELTACPIYQSAARCEGAFLPTPHYYEETFCSYHAQAHGHKVMYYGPVTIIHQWHKASPVGGYAEQQMSLSRTIFRNACDLHGIQHD